MRNALTKNSLLVSLLLLFLITTGSTSADKDVFNPENDTETKSVSMRLEDVVSQDSSCHNCDLLKEDNLIFIELKKPTSNSKDQKDKKPEIYKVLRLLKSMHLDLYSDKVLYRYLDEHGEYKNLTVREHNENALYNKLNPGNPIKPRIREGYPNIVSNKLVAQKKHGIVNGYNDKTLQKLRKSGLIVNALPMCTYNLYGAMGATKYVYPDGISGEDSKKIKSLLNLSLTDLKTYHIQNLSRKEMLQLLQILCESKTVKEIYIGCNGSIVNY